MGCCQSMEATPAGGSQSPGEQEQKTGKGIQMDAGGNAPRLEDKVLYAMRSKRRGDIFAESVEVQEAYVKKTFPKSPHSRSLIAAALGNNFLFSSLKPEETAELIDAMQQKRLPKGSVIIKQGDKGDNFYVVESGNFDIFVHKKKVAASKDGDSFGELALLYNCPRAATVVAATPAVVWALDRMTFRHIIAHSTSENLEACKMALRRVPLLNGLTDEQLNKISDAINVVNYKPNEMIIQKGTRGDIFYIIKEGRVLCTNIGRGLEDSLLGPGDYFGERALLKGEPRAADVIAQTPCVCMALDRMAFNELLGPLQEVIDHNLGLRVLTSVPILSALTEEQRMQVVKALEPVSFPKGAHIIRQGDPGKRFYVIKDGHVLVTQSSPEGTVTELARAGMGDYFGEMALKTDNPAGANVVAVTPVNLFSLDRKAFVNMLGPLNELIEKDIKERQERNRDKQAAAQASRIDMKDLEHLVTLGTGTFGRVKLVRHKPTNETYALKILQKAQIVQFRQQANILNEKKILAMCHHPFILRLVSTYKDMHCLYMLLELVPGGELFSLLHMRGHLRTNHARFYAACVLDALAYLHSKRVVYRDLKPENLLVDKEGYIKVVDFGFAKRVLDRTYTLCGTPEYLAPELVLGKGHNKGVDYWALGVLIYEMVCGYSPFADHENNDQMAICKNILRQRLSFSRDVTDVNLKDIVAKLLTRDVTHRIGCGQQGADAIRQHPFFRSVKFSQLRAKTISTPWTPTIKSAVDHSNFDKYDENDDIEPYFDDGTNWDNEF